MLHRTLEMFSGSPCRRVSGRQPRTVACSSSSSQSIHLGCQRWQARSERGQRRRGRLPRLPYWYPLWLSFVSTLKQLFEGQHNRGDCSCHALVRWRWGSRTRRGRSFSWAMSSAAVQGDRRWEIIRRCGRAYLWLEADIKSCFDTMVVVRRGAG